MEIISWNLLRPQNMTFFTKKLGNFSFSVSSDSVSGMWMIIKTVNKIIDLLFSSECHNSSDRIKVRVW